MPLTLQNIPASCLSFPSGQGPKSAGRQTDPYKHPPLHTHSVCLNNFGKTTTHTVSLLCLPCPAEEIREGINTLLTQ